MTDPHFTPRVFPHPAVGVCNLGKLPGRAKRFAMRRPRVQSIYCMVDYACDQRLRIRGPSKKEPPRALRRFIASGIALQ